jgi:hypothetical protein
MKTPQQPLTGKVKGFMCMTSERSTAHAEIAGISIYYGIANVGSIKQQLTSCQQPEKLVLQKEGLL